MKPSLRHRLGPIAGLLTLGIGLGLVAMSHFFAFKGVEPDADGTDELKQAVAETPASVPSKLELSCYDPQIQRVWKELKQNESFRNALEYQTGEIDCSMILEVKRIDTMSGNATDEIFVRGKSLLCGATGNCFLWIVEIKDGNPAVVLESGGVDLAVIGSKYDGLGTVHVRSNGGNYPDSLLEYRYSRGKYRLVRCFQQDKQTLETWRESCEGWE